MSNIKTKKSGRRVYKPLKLRGMRMATVRMTKEQYDQMADAAIAIDVPLNTFCRTAILKEIKRVRQGATA